MFDLLLTNGVVITMNPERQIIENGWVAVTDDRIAAVGSLDDPGDVAAARVIDCRGKIIMPGLVDAHGHGGHSLIKTIAADTPSWWMAVVTPMYKHFTTERYWYVDGLLGALERLKSGVTCGMSVLGSQPRSDDPAVGGNHARAYAEVGIRDVIGVGPCAPPWPQPFSRWIDGRRLEAEVSFDQVMAGAEAVIETWHHACNDRIRVFVTPFTIVPSLNSGAPTPADQAVALQPHDRLQSRRVRDLATRYGTRIHSDAFGGMIHLAQMDDYGLLGPDVHIQHCLGLSHTEIRILAETGTNVGHSPKTLTQARARCPVVELLDAGVNVAVTSDGTAAYDPFDLFPAMRKAQMLQQLHFRDLSVMPVGKLLEMVTIDAAAALGWADEIGSLEVGKKADIITLDMLQPHLTPNIMPVHRLVYEAVGHDVSTVIVDGRVLMEDREVLTVDEADVLAAAQEEALEHIARAGLEQHVNTPCWGQARQVHTQVIDAPPPG